MIGYKLFRLRKNGTLGPLFINRKQVIPLDKWLEAEDHPTKGYQHRPGWHVTEKPYAPHLYGKREERVWRKVEIKDYYGYSRPANQGGQWFLAKYMKVIE